MTQTRSWGDVSGLAGTTVALFGSSDGIGLGCGLELARAGARVACVDVNTDVAQAAATAIRAEGGVADAFTADVNDRSAVRSTIAAIRARLGDIDHVVDVVGAAPLTPIVDGDDELWDLAFSLNLRQCYIVAGEALPGLRDCQGSLVFISSVAALTAMPNKAAYGASKAGLISLTRTIAVENGIYGVRANAVAPGVTLTPAIKARDAGAGGDEVRDTIPMRRGAETTEIGKVVTFLVSDLASYVTGQTITVDGGVSSRYCLPETNAGFRSARSMRSFYDKSPDGRRDVLARGATRAADTTGEPL